MVSVVRIAWPKGFSNLTLIQSADEVIDNLDFITDMSGNEITINDVVYNYADVTLTDGQYFTFGAKLAGPGGVTNGLLMWHKADDGTDVGGAKNVWKDMSGMGRNVTQNNNADYQPKLMTDAAYAADGKNYSFNFNPFYYFDGNNDFFYRKDDPYFSSINSAGSTYGVMVNSVSGGWRTPYGWGDDDPNFARSGSSYQIWRDNGHVLSAAVSADNLPAHIGGMAWKGTGLNGIYMNIDGQTFSTTSTHIGTLNNSNSFAIGSEGYNLAGTGNERHQGGISEVFAYSVDHQNSSEDEKQRINSYLAIKYGITLKDEAGTGVSNYLSSNSLIIWDVDNNADYNNNIAGIARDNNSALHQKQSRSNKLNQQLIIGTVGLSNTNEANGITLDEGQFLLWGDNGQTQSLSESFMYPSLPDLNLRFASIWKVQNTGSIGTVRIAWPEGVSSIQLIQSDDNIFDDTDVFTDMTANTVSINGITYNYADVTLENGTYFTFAGFIVGPGNVASAAWYRADAAGQQFSDAGATTAIDGQQLYQWNEYKGTGYNLIQAGAGDRPIFSNMATLANFNPTVTFNGSQFMRYTAPTGVNVIDRANGTIYASGYLKELKNVGFAGFHASMDFPGLHTYNVGSGDYKLLFFTGGPGYQGLSSNSFINKSYFTIGSSWQNGAGATASYAGGKVSLNGLREEYSGTSDFQNVNLSTTLRDFQIGEDNNHGALNGQLNEVVVFENQLTENEMDRVETYMAIKYGNTYAEGSRDYVNSANVTVWSAADNNGYHSNIAGIARDDQGALYQKQSWSTNSGRQVLISTTGLANTNAANTGTISNGKFLIWGDNDLAKSPTVSITDITDVNYRFASVWKVQNNDIGTVRVSWPAGYANFKLIQSTDDEFTGSDIITDMISTQTVNGVEYAYADVVLENGNYFTFAAFVQAPGGVTNNLSYWYRADKLVNAVGEGGNVNNWTDFTSGITSAQLGDSQLPKFKEGEETYFNYNPGINFTATNQMIGNIAQQTLFSLDFNILSVTKEGMAGFRFFNIGRDNVSFVGSNWDQPGLNADGGIARRNNIGSLLYNSVPGSGNPNFGATSPNIMYHNFSNTSFNRGLNGGLVGTPITHGAIGSATGGHIFGANNAANPPGGDDGGFIGHIGEMIIYGNGTITTAERNKVETYLAIKYGITLHNSNNYTTSSGEVVWNAVANAGYYNNVAGIGNDFLSALHQKQSRSQQSNVNKQVIIGIGEIAATNVANIHQLSNGQFLIWGDNGNTQAMTNSASTYTTFSYEGGTDNSRRMNRVWKVQNTDVTDEVLVRFPVLSVGATTLPIGDTCADYALVVANDASFSVNVTATPIIQTEDGLNYEASFAFPDGISYFTFAKVTPLGVGTVYLPEEIEVTVEYDDDCNTGDWTYFNKTGNKEQKVIAFSNFTTSEMDQFNVSITPEGVAYDDGTRITKLMKRVTTVEDEVGFSTLTNKVRVYYSQDELDEALVSGGITAGWFKYEGNAEEVITDLYSDGIFEAGKAMALVPDAFGVEDGVSYVEFHNISSFSSFVFVSSTEETSDVLPVKFLYFNAALQNTSVLLEWATVSEHINNGFEIERSNDGRNWNKIGFVKSKSEDGNSSMKLDYDAIDEHPYNNSINFYRLKQLSQDGKSDYSTVQIVRYEEMSNIKVVPNPTIGEVTIKNLSKGKNRVLLINSLGQILTDKTILDVNEYSMNLSTFASGIYFIHITDESGRLVSKKIVKQ